MSSKQRTKARAYNTYLTFVLYLDPKDNSLTELDKQLRNQLLVVDLVVRLADEVIGSSTPNQQQITERTANLLYAIRLIASNYPFQQAAKLLLGDSNILTD
ncbi:MAG TPA: hypothetical protein VK308_07015 [Pyrinomonadaceae bacterium]|nr:hypothetical protein [Pyrinomonadaceae bacterium]